MSEPKNLSASHPRSAGTESTASQERWTPGPWCVAGSLGYASYIVAERGPIACGYEHASEEGKANAHLIAAAPELYKALIAVTPSHHVSGKCWCSYGRDIENFGHEIGCQKATAALAKARGEALAPQTPDASVEQDAGDGLSGGES